jgi:two-component system response regulator MprA
MRDPDRGHLRVLAIEDDRDLRTFYRTLLEEEGYDVKVAADGAEALEQLAQRGWRPDLILLDLMMPRMDGYEFLRRLRARGSDIPVLVLSAALPPGRQRIAGAQAILRKPFAFDRLLKTIDHYAHVMH